MRTNRTPYECFWGGNVWGSRTGVQAKRAPDPTKKAYALRGRSQAAFSWRWNSKQQSRRRYAANGFALLPQCRFLGRQRWAVEPAVKPVGCLHTFVPSSHSGRDDTSPTEEE